MFEYEKTLKKDAFGSIEKGTYTQNNQTVPAIRRVYTKNLWLKPLALTLACNEKRALSRLMPFNSPYFPQLLETTRGSHTRSFIAGDSMHHAQDRLTPELFKESKQLLQTLKKAGIANNDLAKEANWLITPDSMPAVSDFQLACCFKNKKSAWFLHLCYEDLRHLLKHKRKYHQTTPKENTVLARKSWITSTWMKTGKKIHRFITRQCLGWKEREGPEERDI